MKSIECALQGTLGRDPMQRTAASGRQWVLLIVLVGEDPDVPEVSVACFGPNIDIAATLKERDRIYCEGNLKLRIWQNADGSSRPTLSVAARVLQAVGKIGQQRPKKPRAAKAEKPKTNFHEPLPFNDELPI